MKRFKLPLLLSLIAVLLAAVACQQEAPAGETVTPPIVPAPTGEAGNEQAYPAPVQLAQDAAYPAPGDGGGNSVPSDQTPEAPATTPGDGGAAGGTTQPVTALPPVPVEPEIRSAVGSAQPLPEAGLVALPSAAPWTEAPGSTVQHTVSVGEWLLQIARCYGTSATAVRNANNLANPNYLTPGTPLTVPDVGTTGPIIGPPCILSHVVVEGETWDSIALAYETTPAILQRANPGSLTIGREIFVPATVIEGIGYVPTIDNHLLFISNGNLAIWRATDSQVEITPDNDVMIHDVSTNTDGRFVLARQTRDGSATSEIALIDTEARTLLVLEAGLAPYQLTFAFVEQMLISPDGGWGVYPVRTETGYRLTAFQTAAPETLYIGPEIPFNGADDRSPFQLFPGQDSTRFLVSSARGLHEFPYSLDLTGRELVGLTGDFQVDPVTLLFGLAWDPSGRYLMANGAFMEGGAVFVIDGLSGEMVQVPGSTGYVTAPGVSWTADGSALLIQPTAAGAVGPQASRFTPTSDPTLILTPAESVTLQTQADPATGDTVPGYVVLAPAAQPANGTIHFAIQSGQLEQGVWATLDGPVAPSTLLNDWPLDAYQADWTWDLTGVLATDAATLDEPGVTTYVPLNGGAPFNLSSWVGGEMGDFHWLIPR